MGQNLVIVESPAKAKTIGKYLGKNFVVEASMGHVRDLPKSQLGVDIDNHYNPKYITIRGKGELLDKLRKLAKKSDKIYLATDPDREGEAISWHLANVLKIDSKEQCRIEFNEITKNAIKNSIKNPRTIDENLVNAQQARRILDRLVGYEISPILWKNIKWGLSAGRVQSAALKLICDREEEINGFNPEEYWTIDCELKKDKTKFTVKLLKNKGNKAEIRTKEESDKIINELKTKDFIVGNIKKYSKNKNPLPPFTTSTLQQDAYKKLNFQTKRTMSVAQQLYEGIDVKGHGTLGLITYMRTDSVRISKEAQELAAKYIKEIFGEQYVPEKPREYKSKKNIQDAHEAIRPTYVDVTPDMVKGSLKDEQYKLYSLIWNRFMASQMASAEVNIHSVEILNGDYTLKASGSSVKFNGFMKVYQYVSEEDEENTKLPELTQGETLKVEKIDGKQHFTQPPARFTEASFVKTMEEKGIGRPSTYVPTISTILSRRYVEREKKSLMPTELGKIVNSVMTQYFDEIVDLEFTAEMESKLDHIEEGIEGWDEVVNTFFQPLKEKIELAEKEMAKITIEDKVSDVPCDKCGRMMVIKQGRFGEFLACPGYPECKNTKPIVEKVEAPCPKCGGTILVKRSKKGNKFFGCSNYPDCDFVSWQEPSTKKCKLCGNIMVKKYSKAKGNYLECLNKECKNKEYVEE